MRIFPVARRRVSALDQMNLPTIIQGGMGVAVSDWRLAKTVSELGYLGVVSGTGLGTILIGRLRGGDPGGHIRRALSQFPFQEPVQRILDNYYVPEGGRIRPYERPPMWTLKPSNSINALTVIANFVEAFLAKEGHNNPVGINLLEKIQLPTMASLYGAMLAGVNIVLMGAGIPIQIPGILDKLARHQVASYRLDIVGSSPDDDYRLDFDPEVIFPGITEKIGTLNHPHFLPIISSVVLARALIKRATGRIDGFVIEAPIAGGHNAPPRGSLQINDKGEPIYGEKDEVDLDKIEKLGLPFWLAGGYGSPDRFQEALSMGAAGIQVGTAFAFCNESGLDNRIKQALIQKVLRGEASVRTDPIASPTGFPFKIVELEGSVSEKEIYEARPRNCDMGYLRHLYKQENGRIGYRCPAEPVEHYVKKGGALEDTVGRYCLCNNLFGSVSVHKYLKDGYIEPPVVTSGDEFVNIGQFIKPGESSYSAGDVIDHLTNGTMINLPVAKIPDFATL